MVQVLHDGQDGGENFLQLAMVCDLTTQTLDWTIPLNAPKRKYMKVLDDDNDDEGDRQFDTEGIAGHGVVRDHRVLSSL